MTQITVEAMLIATLSPTVSPYTWKKGATLRNRSSPSLRSVSQLRIWVKLATRFRWVSIAPFGTPVVPPVYCSTARSSGATFTPGGRGDALRSRTGSRSPPAGRSSFRKRHHASCFHGKGKKS